MAGQRKRGFAVMNPEKQREIASKGGQAAHRKGSAHEFSPEEARAAGRLGGKAVSMNRAHMAAIGRKGGQRSTQGQRRQQRKNGNYPHGPQSGEMTASRQGVTSHSATQLLRADHQQINTLFHQYEVPGTTAEERKSIVQQMCNALTVHAQIEEEIFYPAVRATLDEQGQQQLDEGLREHQRVKEIVAQLEDMALDAVAIESLVRQLQECVTHHVNEEEHNILPKAEHNLSQDLQQLGEQLQQRKQHALRSEPSPASAPSSAPAQEHSAHLPHEREEEKKEAQEEQEHSSESSRHEDNSGQSGANVH